MESKRQTRGPYHYHQQEKPLIPREQLMPILDKQSPTGNDSLFPLALADRDSSHNCRLILSTIALALVFYQTVSAHPFHAGYSNASDTIRVYTSLIEIYPEDANLYYELGSVLLSLGRTGQAMENFRFVLEREPDNEDAWLMTSEIYFIDRDFDSSLDALTHITSKQLQDERLVSEAAIRLELDQFEKAITLSLEAIKHDEKASGAWFIIAVAEEELGRIDEAVGHSIKAIAANPEQVFIYFWFKAFLDRYYSKSTQLKHLQNLVALLDPDDVLTREINTDVNNLILEEKSISHKSDK